MLNFFLGFITGGLTVFLIITWACARAARRHRRGLKQED